MGFCGYLFESVEQAVCTEVVLVPLSEGRRADQARPFAVLGEEFAGLCWGRDCYVGSAVLKHSQIELYILSLRCVL